MKTNTVVWIVLLILTYAGFAISHAGGTGKMAAFVLAAAGLKFALVGWQFMDLRKSMMVWSAALFGLLGVILGIVAFFV